MRFLLALFLVAPLSAFAANYYVTQSGAGSANGTSTGNAWSMATYNASAVPTAGDTVFFTGTITSQVSPRTNGSSSARLTLDFSGATLAGSSDPKILLSNRSFVTLNGGTVTGDQDVVSFGVLGNSNVSHDITVQNFNWTSGTESSTGALVENYYSYNLLIQNNHVERQRSLINSDTVLCHDLTIRNNWFTTSRNTVDQTDIVFIGDAYNVTIEGNYFLQRAPGAITGRHNDVIQTYQKGGSNAGTPYGWVIRYNWIELDVTSGSGDTSFLMMERMANNGSVAALKIYGNVFFGTDADSASNNGVSAGGFESNAVTYFVNNTVIRKNGPDNTIAFGPGGTLYARNNVGQADPGMSGTFIRVNTPLGTYWDYNLFYNFVSATSYLGSHGGTSDPKFLDYANNKFSARDDTSPMRGKADSSIGSEFGQGLAPGATWPGPKLVARPAGGWDLGAYQGGGTTTTPPPTVVPPSDASIQIDVK